MLQDLGQVNGIQAVLKETPQGKTIRVSTTWVSVGVGGHFGKPDLSFLVGALWKGLSDGAQSMEAGK